MTREEAIKQLSDAEHCLAGHGDLWDVDMEAFDMAIEALKQEPCEDEIILTKEEYGQLLSNEFDNGYAKGYREALEQDSILDKIRAEIVKYEADCRLSVDEYLSCKQCTDNVFGSIYSILDRCRAERKDEE